MKESSESCSRLGVFYQRRIARICPAFFGVGLVTLAAAYILYTPQDFASSGANLSAAAASVANVKFMLQGDYFEISRDAQPFLHYWSLSVEEQFYMILPFALLFALKLKVRRLLFILGVISFLSFIACVAVTYWRPAWAFYLLPTRAWELLAGSLIAVACSRDGIGNHTSKQLLRPVGLGALLAAMFLTQEGGGFPGFVAMLPVLGAAAFLIPQDKTDFFTQALSIAPVVFLGRISYSLYLWHWPVFSFVDYRMFTSSEVVRVSLKIALSVSAALLSYSLLERPARAYLSNPARKTHAYAFLFASVLVAIVAGVQVRRHNYINASPNSVAEGGLAFPTSSAKASIVLMGDSNGSMYGRVLKRFCAAEGYNLNVISVAAGDPLPPSQGRNNQLWLDSLTAIKTIRPEFLVLACRWEVRLGGANAGRVLTALRELQPYVGKIIILNQPPLLPAHANREAIRNGSRPPFYEPPDSRRNRLAANQALESLPLGNRIVIDVASHFEDPQSPGAVLFADSEGRQLYHDRTHLSGYGAERVMPAIRTALDFRKISDLQPVTHR